jgi:cytidine deaminase
MSKLNEKDRALLNAAREIIAKRFKEDYHHVGAALRTKSGRVYAAVHLEAYIGRTSICAEAVALGMAAADGDTKIETIVAVDRRGEVVSPCGMCRELLLDYSPEVQVIIPGPEGEESQPMANLLPLKYQRWG